jgi:hypothetical protein
MAREREQPNDAHRFNAGMPAEPTRPDEAPIGLGSMEDDEASEFEIAAEFRRRLSGLRHLPRRQRAAALRAARDWRSLAVKGLRERRANKRHARYLFWRSQLPTPTRPG